MGEPSFEIPARPERQFPFSGGLEYQGETVFTCSPDPVPADLTAAVESLLESGPYRFGDFHSLPMPLFLVRDDETGDVFRVSVRDDAVHLHVLPATESGGLRAFYDRLTERTDATWTVTCRVSTTE